MPYGSNQFVDANSPQGSDRARRSGGTVDGRQVLRVLATVGVVLLGALAVFLTVEGVNHNSQINKLHHQSVPVTFTISGCLGLLGGSGSNGAGYSCKGSYSISGHTYAETLPGMTLFAPGAKIPSRAVRGDSSLVSPDYIVKNERTSSGIFFIAAILFVLFIVLGLALIKTRRRAVGAPDPSADT